MKKIIAVLLVFAAVLSLAACKVESNNKAKKTEPYDPNEYQSNLAAAEAEQSRLVAEKAEAESEIQENIDEYIKEVGKTKKKTQLVIKLNSSLGKEYHKFEFNKKGEYKTQIKYIFYDTLENYNATLEIEKNKKDSKVIDKDMDMKMVVIKNDRFNGKPFDEMYEIYSREDVKALGYTIIE